MADPAPSWRWLVNMPTINGSRLNPLYVEEIELPFLNVGSTPRYSGGGREYFPDVSEVSAVNITFYEDVHYTTMKYLMRWRKLVVDPVTKYYGLPQGVDGYKMRINWEMYDGVKNVPVFKGYLDNAWPTEITPWSLNFSSSDRIKISHSFSVDASVVTV